MSKLADFRSNFGDVTREFSELRKEIREQVIDKGLDEPLKKSLKEVKSNLQSVLKEQIRPEKTDPQRPQDPSKVIQPPVEVAKSKEDLLKHFTGIDLKEYNNQKDKTSYYSSTDGPKLTFAKSSKNQQSAARIDLRIPIGPGETVQTQFQKAKSFFKDAAFAFPNQFGDYNFYLNTDPGIDDHIKIKCSKYTGDDDFEEFGGMSPQRRFENNLEQGYADWTLKQDYVKLVRQSGVNVSRLIENVLDGNYDDARTYLDSLPETQKQVSDLLNTKINELERNENLTPDVETTNNIAQLIRNLKIVKKITKKGVKYSLVSNYGKLENVEFEQELKKQISIWKNVNIDKWVKVLISKSVNVIKKFYQGSK